MRSGMYLFFMPILGIRLGLTWIVDHHLFRLTINLIQNQKFFAVDLQNEVLFQTSDITRKSHT